MADEAVIQVLFVDAATGAEFARSPVPAGHLPESFETATQLAMGGVDWEVVRADPPTAAEYVAQGRLVLTLARVEQVAPRDVKYSMPTLCDPLPAMEPHDGPEPLFMLHEDDWRQVELVSGLVGAEVAMELAEIRRIHRFHAQQVTHEGRQLRVFDQLHVRATPTVPLDGVALPMQRLTELIPVQGQVHRGVGFGGQPGRVAGSYAFDAGEGVTVYGLEDGPLVSVLAFAGAHPAALPGMRRLMAEFGLSAVDWCAAETT
ncbi:hypothetical protein [Yinghuangia soli]|uniref:Uncharacterized protein n=1 Tax=Yinghuangia soli TaxID=2908204 RepID=A0AA41TXY0_9ACTN|nr:hypothetical protein [Yinghuangia soli]MCF2527293.1 hypothetical protein [Yinghuangia soli]